MQDVFREIWQGAPPLPDNVDQLELTAGTAAPWVVPTGYDLAIIHYNGKADPDVSGTLFARPSGTAAIPTATLTNGTGSTKVLDGSVRRVVAGRTISFINATACVITFDLFRGE